LSSAAADYRIHTPLHRFFLQLGIDNTCTNYSIKMPVINLKIVHPLHIYKQGIFDMRVRTGTIKAGTVGYISNMVPTAHFNDFLDFLGSPGHNNAAGYPGHDSLITESGFVTSRSGAITFT
jgi:hypothetical protein